MKNMMSITVRNGMSVSQLMKKVKEYFSTCDVLIVDVTKNNHLKIVEYDGICVTVWVCENAYDFIEGYEKPVIKELV